MGCHSLLQGIFLTQELNLGLLHCRQILYHLSHQGSPVLLYDPAISLLGIHPKRTKAGTQNIFVKLMLGARDGERECGKLVFNRYIVSVWEGENRLEMDSGENCITVQMYFMPQN